MPCYSYLEEKRKRKRKKKLPQLNFQPSHEEVLHTFLSQFPHVKQTNKKDKINTNVDSPHVL